MIKRLLIVLMVLFVSPVQADFNWSDKVREEIFQEMNQIPSGGKYEIEIEARGGTVWLRGVVSSFDFKGAIQRIAESRKGVQKVINLLDVLPAGAAQAANLEERLSTLRATVNEELRGALYSLEVGSSDGELHISGEAGSADIRSKIEQISRQEFPEMKIVNKIKLSRIPDSEIRAEIEQSLKDEPEITIEGLAVFVKDGIVTISGTADNHRELDHTLAIVQMISGVKEIDSRIAIKGGYKWDGR